MHLDVYQGKNKANIGIPKEICHLPTTQKALVNLVLQSKLHNEPNGYRVIFSDNRYTCAEVAVMLRDKYKILLCGTTRTNRKGWNSKAMHMPKSAERGAIIRKYDPNNKILFITWKDSKVVHLLSTLNISGMTVVKQRVGPKVIKVPCDINAKYYVEGMGAVDRLDQRNKVAGGFARRSHYHKWYKQVHLGIMDFMTNQGEIGWNMSALDPLLKRNKVSTAHFQISLFSDMIHFVDQSEGNDLIAMQISLKEKGHTPQPANQKLRLTCCICKIEENWQNARDELMKVCKGSNATARNQFHMTTCKDTRCHIVAHNLRPPNAHRQIFHLPAFDGMSCFEIAHSPEMQGFFIHGNKTRQKYSIRRTHPIYKKLRELHDLSTARERKGNRHETVDASDNDNDESTYNDFSYITKNQDSV